MRFDPTAVASLGVIACAAWLTSAPDAVGQDRQTLSADVAAGQQLFYDHGCYGCHGFNGETGARDLVGTNSPIIADVETFLAFLRLRADQAPLLPSTRMPNYPESALSDAEVAAIFAYVRTFELNAPDAKDVSTLQAIVESAKRPYEP
jgi:mono/diheme cytochrome c family protein